MNKSERKIVMIVVGIFLLVVVGATFGEDYIIAFFMNKYGMTEEPIQVLANTEITTPEKHIMDISDNYFEKQGKNQCSAYSSAFVLRSLGYKTTGADVYAKITEKIPSGPLKDGVLFSGLQNRFKEYNHELVMKRSEDNSINIIKETVMEDIPFIVLIGEGTKWQHYTVVIGYDNSKKEIYFFDPDANGDTNGIDPGNKTYSEEKFMQYWNNGLPKYDRTFFVTTKEPTLNGGN